MTSYRNHYAAFVILTVVFISHGFGQQDNTCESYQYSCENDTLCISRTLVCDGDSNCPYVDDERNCPTTLGVPGITTQGGSTQTPTSSMESKQPGGRGPSTVTSSTKRTMEPNTMTSIDASPITYTLSTVASPGTNQSLATASSKYIATTPLPSSIKTQGATETQTPTPSRESEKPKGRGPSTVTSSTKRTMEPSTLAMTSIDASQITYTLPTVASPGTNESLATASSKYIATTPLPSSTKTQGATETQTPIPSGESQKSEGRGPSTVKSSTKRTMAPRRLAMTSIDASPITYTLPTVASPGTNESLATASTKYIATTPLPTSTKTQGLSEVRGVPGFAPLVGPVSGGTLIAINGLNVNVDVLFVLIAGQPCNIIRDNETKNWTICYTSRVDEPIESAITMVYKNGNVTSDKVFSYKPDPEISAITPLKQFQIGGQRQTIRGENLNIIGQAVFVVTAITNASSIEFCSECEAQNSTTMFCPSPKISFRDLNHSSCDAYRNSGRWVEGMQTHEDRQNTTAKVKRDVEDDCNSITSSSASGEDIKLTVGFYLDGVEKWRPQNIGRYLDTTYDVMEDPVINKFPGKNNIYSIREDSQYLVITGERLNCGAQKEDFTVEVGLDYCEPIISLHRRQLTCKPPREKPPLRLDNEANHGYPQVRVKIGSNKKFYSVGYLRYVVVQPWVIVLATIAAFLLIVAVTITVVSLIRRKSRHKAAEAQVEARYMDLQPMNSAADLTRRKEMSITLDSELQSRIEDVMIDRKRLILRTDDVLGRGAFGVVMLGTLQTTQSSACSSGYECPGQEVAVKILKHNASGDESENFLEEGLLMKDLQHPNVLTLIGICIDDRGVPMIILPYMKFGNLKTFIQDEDREFTVWDLVSLGHQVATGMRYLSEIHMVHRDLAARNCMYV
ncbi:hepatocyte growth factor receptor-like [Ptychodera flava]|uniref:hepatocyte growth factor receptor-like n=1 Tax=Ptychodera flava TaxID=63121 RepID=UPI00396A56D7